MFEAVKYGLRNLMRFDGRDTRQTFWLYVLFLYLVSFLVSILFAVPMVVQAALIGIRSAQQSGADDAAVQTAIMTSVGSMMKPMLYIGLGSGIGFLVLLAASLVRRLHDSNLSGWFGLVPAGFQALSLIQLPLQMDRVSTAMSRVEAHTGQSVTMTTQWPGAILGWAPLIALVLVASRRSTPGPNRYGQEPASS
ncbi:DUF805 domain-containing protein [Novosphingobium lentum]|uniref:DUF805 domain-containing protein n=1 Tax=Novosphingobium lentum TaxID=145287 RepID=UPI0008360A43|nr:DUF805 domain-containing protein [Novosphingobium lentum]